MRLFEDGSAVLAHAPAKLNLLLAIRGRRPDGFHEIETVMVKVSLCDTLRLSPRSDGEIALKIHRADQSSAPLPTDGRNLVVRAAELLRNRIGQVLGADILLEKRIPSEAGLAGGSADAAATLAGLNRLWRLGLPAIELDALASELGSDVPFFLSSAVAAVARGRGERIEPAHVAGPMHFVVVKPAFGLPTAGVYRAFAGSCRMSQVVSGPLLDALAAGRLSRAARHLHNDLEPAAEALRPEIAALRKQLQKECRFGGMMTGSGSACFGLCGSARDAMTATARLRAAGAGRSWPVMSA